VLVNTARMVNIAVSNPEGRGVHVRHENLSSWKANSSLSSQFISVCPGEFRNFMCCPRNDFDLA
jgi:hypothetical protein